MLKTCTFAILFSNVTVYTAADVKDTIKKEMDLNEQTDSQTNVSSGSGKGELDKFKRRLIRAIARLLYMENKSETEIWDDLKVETGCDCELLWSRMRALTIKKLVRLFTAEDKIKNITKIAQLSVTDWLLYDLVLVHEKVDVIGQEHVNKEEPAFLRDLFELVEEFNIENATGEVLIKKWFDATAKYNNTGKRHCSPMLLQKRWYQLKERSRSNFYNFWFEYRGDSRKIEKANEFKPSELQLDIVKRYKEIVTKKFLSWEVLVKERRVALPEDFERLRLKRHKITISESEPDLQLIEQQVETIDLEETNDSNDSDSVNDETDKGSNGFNIDIVKIESLARYDDEVSVLESVHIPLEKSTTDEIDKSIDDNDLEIIESDSELVMPRITSVVSTADVKAVKGNDGNELPLKKYVEEKVSETRENSVKAVNNILEQIVNNVIDNEMNIKFDKKIATKREKVLDLDKDNKELRSSSIIDLDKQEIEKNKQEIEDEAETSANIEGKYDLDIGFDDFSNNLNFIDNGIEFVDDGIEYMDEDYNQEYNVKSEIKSEVIEATNEEEPKIDLKLLLTPVVFTKRLDDMDVFRFIDYTTVKDNRVLLNAARENKPEDTKSVNMKEILQESIEKSSNVESDSNDIIPNDEISLSSWLFCKPKVNYYNPIQLCKNPDFNTRLKRLSAAFYTSQRNRTQLKQCRPLTVDLHKTFETKLIDNILYLKKYKNNSDLEIPLTEMIAASKTQPLEDMESSKECEIAVVQQTPVEHTPVEQISDIQTERNKIINLPDIEQIRRVNQGLLVAEVSPIQISNPVSQANNKPLNKCLNTGIEPVIQLVHSTAKDKEVIETSANVSQVSTKIDEEISDSDNDNSKLTETINVENENREILSSKYTVRDCTQKYKGNKKQSWQPGPKIKKRNVQKFMQLSWLPKPQFSRTNLMDCLLAADTVERILTLCKNDYVPPNPKVLKPKRKKRKIEVADKNLSENPVPVVPAEPAELAEPAKPTEPIETGETTETTITTEPIEPLVSIKIPNEENTTEIEKQKPKKSKCRINITTQTIKFKPVCCWARRKIDNYNKLNKGTGRHYCLYKQCVCCCKADLEAKILEVNEQRKRNELIILSDDESITTSKPKKEKPISKVTIGINTDYDKDFEYQFAANLSIIKDDAKQALTPIISLPLGDLPQTFSNESGCQTLTSHRIKNTQPPEVLDNKITEVTNTPNNKPKAPICLGKNKILLCSFKPSAGTILTPNLNKNIKNSPTEVLPLGCHLVLLPNRELALSIDPGVELDANQLNRLPSIVASVQKQINAMPISGNVLEPYNVTLIDETVIQLSDDENSILKDNASKSLNINDSSTSKSSSIDTHVDSINANALVDVGAIRNEEKQVENSDSNSLSSPKEVCSVPEPTATYTSTITNMQGEIVESSKKGITCEDNSSGEATDSSTNKTEDVSGFNKKTILSDLMEMSGISTDDINVTNNEVNVDSNDCNIPNIVASAMNNESVTIIQQVMSQEDNSTSDLQREYANITRTLGVNPIMNNIVLRAALVRCPELNVVSSFPELKYAYENEAQFFKMDVVSGIIVPINVCIKKNHEIKMRRRKGISEVPKSVIDLTKDDIATCTSNDRPITPKMGIHQTNRPCIESFQDTDSDKNKGPVKPLKMFKAIHPSICRYSGRSLLVQPLKNSNTEKKIIRIMKNRRKQLLCARSMNLGTDNSLKIQNNATKSDSEESDEEPLAKKAKRIKDLESDTKNNDPSLDVDDEMNSKESGSGDINYEMPTQLEPVVFEVNNAQSSDEDCILGV